tara:strand:+ start:1216 stop:1569 length:354 start_codon:yes stop_codon:yes gene_type:complete
MNSYKDYQNATDSLRDALIAALNNDEESNTLTEIWRHYLGMRAISDAAYKDLYNDTDSKSDQSFWEEDGISMTGNPGAASSDTISFATGEPFIQAAQMVPMGDYFMAGSGEDTISLG